MGEYSNESVRGVGHFLLEYTPMAVWRLEGDRAVQTVPVPGEKFRAGGEKKTEGQSCQ